MRGAILVASLSVAALLGACSSVEDAYPSADVKQDPEACASCHLSDFNGVHHPAHKGVKPTTCGICHSQDGWHPSVVNHPWPLTGAHAKEDVCFECHHGDPPTFRGTPKACYACHAADYQKGPDHVELPYPTTCEQCHGTTAWKPALPGVERLPRPKAPEINEPPTTPTETTKTKTGTKTGTKPKTTPTPTATSTGTPTAWPTSTGTTKPPDVTTGSSRRGR